MSGLIGYLNTPVVISTGVNTTSIKEWYFDSNGNLKIPTGGNIVDTSGNNIFAQNLSDLNDVNITTPITNGYVLKWNGTNWTPAPDIDTGITSLSLNNLSNVSITDPVTSGYVLKFNGTSWIAAPDATVSLGNITFNNNIIGNSSVDNEVQIETTSDIYGTNSWSFSPDGTTLLPSSNGGALVQAFSITRSSTADILEDYITPSVIWTSSILYTSSMKLLIQVEQDPGDSSPNDTQTCEAIISARGSGSLVDIYDIPVMTVYGINYTGPNPIATFTVQRNLTTNFIEVVATLTNADPAYFIVHSVEIMTRG